MILKGPKFLLLNFTNILTSCIWFFLLVYLFCISKFVIKFDVIKQLTTVSLKTNIFLPGFFHMIEILLFHETFISFTLID